MGVVSYVRGCSRACGRWPFYFFFHTVSGVHEGIILPVTVQMPRKKNEANNENVDRSQINHSEAH